MQVAGFNPDVVILAPADCDSVRSRKAEGERSRPHYIRHGGRIANARLIGARLRIQLLSAAAEDHQ
jgi:hypothetical protein